MIYLLQNIDFVIKLKKVSTSTNPEVRVVPEDDYGLSIDDSINTKGESRVYYHKVPGCIVRTTTFSKGPSKSIGATHIGSICNFFCPIVYEVPLEASNPQPLLETRF